MKPSRCAVALILSLAAMAGAGRSLAKEEGQRVVNLAPRDKMSADWGRPVIRSLAYSPDGKALAAAGAADEQDKGGVLWVFDVAGKKPLWRRATDGPLVKVVWSPDGRSLYTAGADVRVWEAAGGKPLETLAEEGADAKGCATWPSRPTGGFW